MKPPEPWRKLGEAGARRLVRVEARNLVAMRTEARRVHAELLGHLGASRDRRGALVALKHATSTMQTTVADQVVRARSRARDAALEQAQAELNRLAVELREQGYGPRTQFGALQKDGHVDDEAHANAVGHSFAARWAQSVLALIVAAEEDEDPRVQFKARLVMQRLDKRVGVIAATETAGAFNDQHDSALEGELGDEVDAQGKKRKWVPFLVKRWNAVLDRRTCATCRDYDGEITPLGFEFSGHEDGPPIHANCRCVTQLILLPVPLSERDGEEIEDEDEEDIA